MNGLDDPTPSARFMGGREYVRRKGETATPSPEDVTRVAGEHLFLRPSVEPGSGPFPGHSGGWSEQGMTPGEKSVAR
ncbi:hypothetical protein KJP29_17870 [Maritimibacter sp. DP1N21-5]|nr:hypothetical protein [Maritimibacter sp. DP1N21-5]MBV7410856.1 hypothetical protein [Maritimibacter sp. DP1N21-5]